MLSIHQESSLVLNGCYLKIHALTHWDGPLHLTAAIGLLVLMTCQGYSLFLDSRYEDAQAEEHHCRSGQHGSHGILGNCQRRGLAGKE